VRHGWTTYLRPGMSFATFVPGHPVPWPHRERPGEMDHAVEARPERFRHHLRRPVPGRRNY